MTRIKSVQPAPPPVANAEPPTQPGIWTKLLPDGRVVPWIILPETESNKTTSTRTAGGCYKRTS